MIVDWESTANPVSSIHTGVSDEATGKTVLHSGSGARYSISCKLDYVDEPELTRLFIVRCHEISPRHEMENQESHETQLQCHAKVDTR